jgi:hypothetical protein
VSGKQTYADFVQQTLSNRRSAAEAGYPKFVYSFSSRAAPDFRALYSSLRELNPRPLISLFDCRNHLQGLIQRTDAALFFDSGNYEIGITSDDWMPVGPASGSQWSEALYLETAHGLLREGDVLVSLDDPQQLVADQARIGLALFDEVPVSGWQRDLLLHTKSITPVELASTVVPVAGEIDYLGLTEKDLGLPWFVGVSYLSELRRLLSVQVSKLLPIHIFGCLDPRALPLFFFAGGDIFDGLSWFRYYVTAEHAYYAREFEYDAEVESLRNPSTSTRALAAHNINELEHLQASLRYSVLADDPTKFEEPLKLLYALSQGKNHG